MFRIKLRPTACFISLLAMCLAIWPLAAGAESPAGAVIFEGETRLEDLTWVGGTDGSMQPVLLGTRTLGEPLLPALPRQEILLLVPLDASIVDVVVEPLRTHVEKAPGALTLGEPQTTDSGVEITVSRLKRVGERFPSVWGEFMGTHIWRGYSLVAVTIYPVREVVESAGPAVEILDAFAIRLVEGSDSVEKDFVVRERLVPGEAAQNEELLRSLVANPEAVASYLRSDGVAVVEADKDFNPSKTPSISGSAVEMLIITNEALAGEFQRLADHKTDQGLPTVVATIEFIKANYRHGADIQETIRMYISDAYAKWGIEYVLLGGDTDVLPTRYVRNDYYNTYDPLNGYTDIPCDLYFACLDGNWNANGNSIFGEPADVGEYGDYVDFAEEVYLGRATVSSTFAAETFVNKVINYESTAAGSGWTNRALFASEVLFPHPYNPLDDPSGSNISMDGSEFADRIVNELMIPCTSMEYLRMYEVDYLFPSDVVLTKDALLDSLNTGHYGIVDQIGHGFYFDMSVGDRTFVTVDADALVNGDHTFMLYSLSCASAAFDFSCLMERFIQNPNGGSVCSIGSVRAAFPLTSNSYQQEFFSQLFCGGQTRVGRTVALSRLPFIGATGDNYTDRWTFENYTLLGDPSLPIWTDTPQNVTVNGLNPLTVGPQDLNLVIETGGLPVIGARVCLTKDNEDIVYGFTDGVGAVTLSFLPVSPGDAKLTVTGPNLELTSMILPVTSGSTYLAVESTHLDDSDGGVLSGNDNGLLESGEIVGILVYVRETGGQGATGVTAQLSTTAPNVNILSSTVSFMDIPAGSVQVSSTPFTVEFDTAITDATPIVFDVEVFDSQGSYLSRFSLMVQAPELEVVAVNWEDETYGNGDGLVDHGERLVLQVGLKNFGSGLAEDLNLYLRSDDYNVVIHDSLSTYAGLGLLAEGLNDQPLSVSLTNGSTLSISYVLIEDKYGRTVRHEFYLQRPLAPGEITTDTSLGADVIALSWEPNLSEAVGYNVFRSVDSEGPYIKANADLVQGMSYFRDDGLERLTPYFFKIATVNPSLVISGYSPVVMQSTAPAEVTNFPLGFALEASGHLAVGDVDGDGDLEIVLGADEIYVWHHDGSELANGDGDSQTLGPFTDLKTNFGPAGIVLANLDGEPGEEIIASEQGDAIQIRIFKHDGTELPGWPQDLNFGNGYRWNWATPVVGDIDGDEDLEIVVNTLNGKTWAWHHDGTEVRDGDDDPGTNGVFYIRPGADGEWLTSSPVLHDLDGDGAKDIIFGTKNDDTGLKRLMALRFDGSDVPGFPYESNDAIFGAPAVGDLNNDGIFEIVFYDRSKTLFVVEEDGSDYPGFPIFMGLGGENGSPGTCPALGNMDADDDLEIVVAPNRSFGDFCDIAVYDTDVGGGTSGDLLPGWPVTLAGHSEGSPVIGDINGDLVPDIVHGTEGGSSSAPNNLYAYSAAGNLIEGFPISLNGPPRASATLCDIDNDSDVDIVYGSWGLKVHVWDMPFAYNAQYMPWPMFKANLSRTGVFSMFDPSGVPEGSGVPAAGFQVNAPFPNPFNPSTSIQLYVSGDGEQSAELNLAIYDIAGRRVRVLYSGLISVGWHTLVWDGRNDGGHVQASGLYFMQAQSGENKRTHKVILIK